MLVKKHKMPFNIYHLCILLLIEEAQGNTHLVFQDWLFNLAGWFLASYCLEIHLCSGDSTASLYG